ncbi:MAG: hypothetical protein QNI84_14065 [Henriciella sp.]|nr:hypothetical protein [Henriciella sp.]
MTKEEARAALDALNMRPVDLGREMAELTGGQYSKTTVNNWLNVRGPSDACVIFLRMKLAAAGIAWPIEQRDRAA